MWSGFSSEIETAKLALDLEVHHLVACGAASRLRLKLLHHEIINHCFSESHVERLLV